jgi:2-polyprenyl-3-methyl-5-hydroxy-6-metoxy-1,4-benzoquinol methylase
MAVAFMAALEAEPETYDQAFDRVLDGRASLIRERIRDLVNPGMRVLDLGCGPGLFAIEAAKRGASVVAVDADQNMVAAAKAKASGIDNPPEFIHQDVLQLGEEIERQSGGSGPPPSSAYDLIVSTFLLSELKPTQRDLLMRIIRALLREDGRFAIAAEILPKDRAEKNKFWANRRKAEKGARKKFPAPITDLSELADAAGLQITSTEPYGPEITFIEGVKSVSVTSNPYRDVKRPYQGLHAKGRIWYNHLTGSWRGMPIQPGLYKIGNATPDSPVIVTANYELTYYTVMRALAKDGMDAWVLACDTAGINVWCAARGTHFSTDDVIHMVRLAGLQGVVTHRELILPQLAAAGMDINSIRDRTGFRVRYGPVRIRDLSEWMSLERPRPKPREMATVSFNLRERMEMTVAHIPFLFAALLWKPFLAIVVGLLGINALLFALFPTVFGMAIPPSLGVVALLLQFLLALFGNALVLGLVFPILPSKGNSFIRRALGLSGITLPVALLIMIVISAHWTVLVSWMVAQFVLSVSLTMDFAGMTPVSDPKVIREEYPFLIRTLQVGSLFIIGFNIIAFILGW